MRLLVTTQAVDLDDQALAFFHGWLLALATRFETVEVVCLKEGRHALPSNVRTHSLGKEKGAQTSVVYALRFLRYAWQLRREYDAVFVHMNPEYVVLAGWWWRLLGKRVVLWYTHRQVNLKLRIAAMLASAIATAAPESLRLKSNKIRVIGHGIDTAAFESARDGSLREPPTLVSVGRITPIKRLEILIDAIAALKGRGISTELALVGEPVYGADRAYREGLKAQARKLGIESSVHFRGALPYEDMPAIYRGADFSVSLAPTGGVDKAVLESMAAGAIPLVANHAFAPLLGTDTDALIFEPDAGDLSAKLAALVARSAGERRALTDRLATTARAEADLSGVIDRLEALIRA